MLASQTAKRLGLARYVVLQEQYNLLVRQVEWEVTDACALEGVGLIPWSPLKGGWLSGKMKREAGAPEGSRVAYSQETGKSNQSAPSFDDFGKDERTWRVLGACEEIGKKHGKSVAQVMLPSIMHNERAGLKSISCFHIGFYPLALAKAECA